MSRTEIIVSIIIAVISSAGLDAIITNILYKNKLKKEQEIGHENMLGDRINEALLKARCLEQQCAAQRIYDQGNMIQDEKADFFEHNAINLHVLENEENLRAFSNEIYNVRKNYEQYLGFKEASYLFYIERYIRNFQLLLIRNKWGLKTAGAIFISDLQIWQKGFEKVLVRRINNPKYKIYDKNRKGWEKEREKRKRRLWKNSLLYKFSKDVKCIEVDIIKAMLIECDEKKALALMNEKSEFDKKHPIRTYISNRIREMT